MIVESNYTEFYNLSKVSGNNFTNTNATYIAQAHFLGLFNALMIYSNASIICEDLTQCAGDMNLTLQVGQSIEIFNNYSITVGDPDKPTDPIYIPSPRDGGDGDSSSGGTINNTLDSSILVSLFNLNKSLIFNLTGHVYGSTNLVENNGDLNITTQPGEVIRILNNFNLTEGAERTNSPIAFGSSNSNHKTITSTLNQAITMVVSADVKNCESITKIVYTTNSGIRTEFNNEQARALCSNSMISLAVSVEPSISSNEIDIEYGCSSLTRTGYTIIMIFGSLIIVLFMGTFVWRTYQSGELSIENLLILFITIIVALGLWLASGQNLGASCGPVG